ncbi:carbohydrate ABC transporter permease [Allomesorhizobium alhagi]|jgi:multiple sugar transport system permease protein|uniref:Sugar ABC transporter n=1 Tax=Mesorhizobium alhagi CCNWXJ12-2 TaxID=1107882 RepID=H0HPW0_9HYPH|nr:sugar ABC transporter [Mesorhizobium alhagi CCNWXJ12-2]
MTMPGTSRKSAAWQSVSRHVILLLAAFGMLYPLIWMAASSFKPDNMIFTQPSLIPSVWDFSNYASGWHALRVDFTTFYKNSFLISALAVIGNLMACSLTAYAFARLNFRFRRFWFAMMMGTLMLPYHVTLVPQYILFLNLGWVNTYLPLIVPRFLAVDAFFIFLMVQFFRGIPREIDEAAIMDGCGPWRIYWRIMLPLSTPVLATAAIFSFIWTYDDFLAPLIYLNDMRQYTVPLALRAFIDSSGGESLYGEMFAMSTLSLLPVFLVFLAFQRLIIRGVALGALKR